MIIYYKVIEVWCPYPFQDIIDHRYCIFSFTKKPFRDIKLKIESNTSIKEKEEFLKERLGLKKIQVLKVK
ncbi:hypothetical protein HHL23_09315 [Chryseobacterium sp. RP-3-3]|uniref:Uncharacterized protein n=1 Tax=Chryseobacterium antibioticum TaxID=2728847 RepID=A0A7Y0AMD3_9FLAO|nr:hypothetical protein [Chryseobacterium antibioticum]NML69998.1 hypothetical protein [Chryseobacterium antibioticum]